jgi:hypothetical protein
MNEELYRSLSALRDRLDETVKALDQVLLQLRGETPPEQPAPTPLGELLDKPVSTLGLSLRATGAVWRRFRQDGVPGRILGTKGTGETIPIRYLISKRPDELLEIRHCGMVTLNEIRARLKDIGLNLKDDFR